MRTLDRMAAVSWIVLGLAACGGAASAPSKTGQGSDGEWGRMSAGQRLEHMKKVVAPKMKSVFQQFDSEEFKDFSCATCHGEGAKAGRFDMPNPALPKLSVTEQFKKHRDEHPKGTQFMMDRVVPEMSAALGVRPYDPATHEGFGCFGCHTQDK